MKEKESKSKRENKAENDSEKKKNTQQNQKPCFKIPFGLIKQVELPSSFNPELPLNKLIEFSKLLNKKSDILKFPIIKK